MLEQRLFLASLWGNLNRCSSRSFASVLSSVFAIDVRTCAETPGLDDAGTTARSPARSTITVHTQRCCNWHPTNRPDQNNGCRRPLSLWPSPQDTNLVGGKWLKCSGNYWPALLCTRSGALVYRPGWASQCAASSAAPVRLPWALRVGVSIAH